MNDTVRQLFSKLEDHSAVVGIVGLGYVGLPLALAFAEAGFPVLGFDVDPEKVDALSQGECYIRHLDGSRIPALVRSGRLQATASFERLTEPDAILVCVPTPLTPQREPDMTYVEATARAIAATLRAGQLVVLESTTYPGTTDGLMREVLEASGLRCGSDFFLAFSPEREDPGNPSFGTTTIPKVVGGVDSDSGDLAEALYAQAVKRVVRVSSAATAEAAKLTENIFRAINIALVNELKVVYDRMGIDVWEVLDAAETKPFGFMRFNPGPGWGGHCLAGQEWLRVRGDDLAGVYRAETLFKRLASEHRAVATPTGIYVEPEGLEALAVDPSSGDVRWWPVSTLYRGRHTGNAVTVTTEDRRRLTVTDEHPMLVWNGHDLVVRPARELAPGDALPLVSDLGDATPDPVVDLIDVVPAASRHRVWVRLEDQHWREHEAALKAAFGWTIRDSLRSNALRLDRFLRIERDLGIERTGVRLLTGMGRARREWPSTIVLTPDVARLIGYFLAEGCITEERNATGAQKAIRVRWTFNRDEVPYLDDVTSLLTSIGFPPTRYDDRTWHSTTLKVSSLLLAALLDSWQCGRTSETMRVPDLLFRLSPEHRLQLLAGLLRGDGDVWTRTRPATYTKSGKRYTHNNATAVVGYFSSSPVLLEQVVHLLQDFGFQPRFKQGQPQIRLQGAETVARLTELFSGAKRTRLEKASAARRRRVTSLSDRAPLAPGLQLARVAGIEEQPYDGWVYSMEVPGASTFTTSTGIGVHNCIPLDPFYLAWKAREYGSPTKFIELAGEVNVRMPEYVIEKLMLALNDRGKALKGAKVLVLGLAYKKDIDDPRESPSFELIDHLLRLGAEVTYHDPHISVAPSMRSWPDLPPMRSVNLTEEALRSSDAALIATDHSAVDYGMILKHASLIIDTRGVYREVRPNVVKA